MARLSLIVAAAENGVIGMKGEMPWHLPADLRYFRKITLGHTVLMGRKTYESIGKPLPKRRNIVITRQENWHAEGVEVASSVDEAIRMAGSDEEIMVIGGGEIYRQSLPSADRVYLTRVHLEVAGDTYFPELSKDQWREVSCMDHPAEGDAPAYSLRMLDRV
ncbi:dihydrofolate reductase [Iodidimonas gelatinilytica]|uniref:Dihydrofolate reductase n=1 Tax=Iodidimonas gelatinilytica TaxID=1236966 RepID=A0A5A7MSH1_9PROT|nr:type 3 dihydrofolate reductase [Iodidimonas gelatinilytica]GEQ98614.1 dihydrofolate reductase [Iodidimonas gelatinilytica]GER01810.1 dihydrofolate reductase [Iodidimonas gelatinilytica]